MDTSEFYSAIEMTSLEQNGKCFVVKKDGTLISKSQNLSGVSKINDVLPDKENVDSLINGMRSRNSGVIKSVVDGKSRYIGYEKLSFNKWYVVSIISSDAVEVSVSDMETDVIILGIELGFILLVLIIYLFYIIISRKNKEKMNLERYFIAAENADTILIDYSIAKDTMYCNEKWEQKFGYSLPKSNIRENLLEHLYPEDREKFAEKCRELIGSNKALSISARILDNEQNPIKCSFKMFPICEKRDKVVKIIGFIEAEE
jgi:PAS domain-containing protein